MDEGTANPQGDMASPFPWSPEDPCHGIAVTYLLSFNQSGDKATSIQLEIGFSVQSQSAMPLEVISCHGAIE